MHGSMVPAMDGATSADTALYFAEGSTNDSPIATALRNCRAATTGVHFVTERAIYGQGVTSGALIGTAVAG